MSLRVIGVLCLTLFCHRVSGQVLLGPKLGLSLSGVTHNGKYDVVKPGFSGGIFLKVGLSERFSIRSEILFTQKGYKKKFDDKLFDQLTANYWQLSVMAGYKLNRWPLSLQLGPYFGRWQSGKYASRITKESQVIQEDYEFTETYDEGGFRDNRNELGLVAGFNCSFAKETWFIDVKYYQALSDIKQWQSTPQDYQKMVNQQLVIAVEYALIRK